MAAISSGPVPASRPSWIPVAAQLLTFVVILAFFLIGASLSSEDIQARAEGNLNNQLIFLTLLILTLPLLIEQTRVAVQLFAQSWLILLLLLWILSSTVWASHPDLTLRRASVYMVVYLISLTLAASFRSPSEFQRGVYRSLLVLCIIAIGTAVLGPPPDLDTGFKGFFSHKNIAGAAIVLTVVTASFAIVLATTLWRRLAALGVLALVWAVLIATKCKTCIGIGVLLTAAMPLVGYALVQSRPRQLGIMVSALVAMAFFFFLATVLSISQQDVQIAVVGDPTFTSRSFLWKALLVEIAERPGLGSGFGSFWDTGNDVNPINPSFGEAAWFVSAEVINSGHNGFIDVTLQTGVIGLVLTVLVILRCIWCLSSVASDPATHSNDRAVCLMMLGLVAALVLNNMMESLLFCPASAFGYFFVLLALQAERWRYDGLLSKLEEQQ